MRTPWLTPVMLALTIACGDDSTNSSNGASVDGSESNDVGSENGDGDGESSSGDGDGESGDGDGDSGDGDGDGDGDSGDGDGDSGDGDGDGDGDSGDGDGDSGDGDGDGECDPNAFVGEALADDPWTEGSLCDEIWVCASANQAQMLMNLLDVQCEPANGCPEQHCTLSYQTIATAQNVADACTALSVSGIDAVYCVVYGP